MSDAAAQKAFQAQVLRVVDRWGKKVKVSKAKKGTPAYPFPITVRRKIEQPDTPSCSLYDVYDLTVKLVVNGLDAAAAPPTVLVSSKLPALLRSSMERRIAQEWGRAISACGGGYALEATFGWVEANYGLLCGLEESCLEAYATVSADGATERRLAVVEPPSTDEAKGVDPDEERRQKEKEAEEEAAAAEYWAAKRAAREAAQLAKLEEEAEEKRRLAEAGLLESSGPKLSKKQLEAMAAEKKARKGRRMAKTGPRRRKFNPDDAAD